MSFLYGKRGQEERSTEQEAVWVCYSHYGLEKCGGAGSHKMLDEFRIATHNARKSGIHTDSALRCLFIRYLCDNNGWCKQGFMTSGHLSVCISVYKYTLYKFSKTLHYYHFWIYNNKEKREEGTNFFCLEPSPVLF